MYMIDSVRYTVFKYIVLITEYIRDWAFFFYFTILYSEKYFSKYYTFTDKCIHISGYF